MRAEGNAKNRPVKMEKTLQIRICEDDHNSMEQGYLMVMAEDLKMVRLLANFECV